MADNSYPSASGEVNIHGSILSLHWFKGPLGAFEIGLVFAAMTFGVVATKAFSYFRGNTSGGAWVKTAVASMLSLNILQMMLTIHGAYTALVIYFGRLDDFATESPQWSISLQILFTTLTASLAQTYFAFRLHTVMRNLYLTMIILFFTVFQLAICIYAVTVLFAVGPAATLVFYSGDLWFMIVTFAISATINLVISIIAYVRMQRPYVLQKQGRATFMSEVEYWSAKSLFFCGLVSILSAVTITSMMIWVASTCVLGNLYTISVLLNSNSRIVAAIPVVSGNGNVPPLSVTVLPDDLSDRASSAPLTNHTVTGENIVKFEA